MNKAITILICDDDEDDVYLLKSHELHRDRAEEEAVERDHEREERERDPSIAALQRRLVVRARQRRCGAARRRRRNPFRAESS